MLSTCSQIILWNAQKDKTLDAFALELAERIKFRQIRDPVNKLQACKAALERIHASKIKGYITQPLITSKTLADVYKKMPRKGNWRAIKGSCTL